MAKDFMVMTAQMCLELQDERLLAAFSLIGLVAGRHKRLLGLLLLDGHIGL